MSSQIKTTQSGLVWLNVTQFLGALNDNLFRRLILFVLIFVLIGALGTTHTDKISQTIGMIFVLPFLLFTPWAGKLADRFSKKRIMVITKGMEIVVMTLAGLTLFYGWIQGLYGVLFLMCLQSAFFGPSKYGIVPELTETTQLSKANALLAGLTYLAIVLGTALAGLLSGVTGRHYLPMVFICIGIAAVGFLASLRIQDTPARNQTARSSLLPGRDVWRTLLSIRQDTDLLLAVLAAAYFTLLGGFMQMNLIPYGMDHLNYTREQSSYLFLVAAVGIGWGSWTAGRLSGRHVEIGLVPLGALGLAGAPSHTGTLMRLL